MPKSAAHVPLWAPLALIFMFTFIREWGVQRLGLGWMGFGSGPSGPNLQVGDRVALDGYTYTPNHKNYN